MNRKYKERYYEAVCYQVMTRACQALIQKQVNDSHICFPHNPLLEIRMELVLFCIKKGNSFVYRVKRELKILSVILVAVRAVYAFMSED